MYLKKIFSMLIVIAISVSIFGVVSAKSFTDIKDLNCEEAVEVLSAIGVLEGKSDSAFEPQSTLTRAEMATIVLRLYGLKGLKGGESVFSDVPASHWAYANIAFAYKLGIVNGTGSNKFEPEAKVTYAQAVKMIVCTLGYSVEAESLGGYPSGYLAKAAQLGILKGYTSEGDEIISRGNMAILAYNSLDIKMFEKTGYGIESGKYTKGENSFLSYMDVKYTEGQITATYFAEITTGIKLDEGEIALGTEVFKCGDKDYSGFIGKNVALYYKSDENGINNEILAVIDKTKGETIIVNAEDISLRTTSTDFWYDKEGKEKSINIEKAVVLLNGEIVARTVDNISPDTGTLSFIANNGTYVDLIVIEEYTNYVVSSVSLSENIVYFKGNQPSLSLDKGDNHIKFIDGGDKKDVTVYDLVEWDVVSVSRNTAGTKVKAIRSIKSVEGKVTELSDDEATINSEKYSLSSNMEKQGLPGPELGMTAVFHLDYLGKIAAVDKNGVEGYKYGYLVSAEMTKGINSEPKLKIFTEDGKMIVADITDKVNFNGDIVSKGNILATGSTLIEGDAAKRQLLKYETTESGLINKIETSKDFIYDFDNSERLNSFSADYYIDENRVALGDYSWQVMFIGGDRRSFGGRFLMRSKSKVFVIPGADAKDDAYMILDQSALTHGNDGDNYNKVTLYDVDEDYVVGAMLWDISDSGISSYPTTSDNTALVTGISKGLDEDGNIAKIITIYTYKGETKSLTVEDDLMCLMGIASTNKNDPYTPKIIGGKRDMLNSKMPVSGLNVGDIIRYETFAGTTEAKMICLIYRAETPGNVEFLSYNNNLYPTTAEIIYKGGHLIGDAEVIQNGAFGLIVKVNRCNEAGIAITGAYSTRVYPTTGQMLEFDLEKETYKKISSEDIAVGDKITSVWGGLEQQFLIRYKGK